MLGIHRFLPHAALVGVVALAGSTAWAPAVDAQAPAAQAAPPSVFLVIWDSARADHFSFMGYGRETTPALAAMAAKSVVFEEAQASGPSTPASVASLVTGRFGHVHGVDWAPTDWATDLAAEQTTLAEALRAEGYATAWYTAQSAYDDKAGFYQGVDDRALVWGSEIVGRTAKFLDGVKGRPVFAVLHWLDPHAPYKPHEKFDLWSKPGAPATSIVERKKDAEAPGAYAYTDVNAGRVTLGADQWQALRDRYDGELRWNDDRFLQFWSMLERKRMLDSSVIVFTSDHGEALGDRPEQLAWHGRPYEENQHVPLVVYAPGRLPAKRVSTVVRGVDVFPTVLELAGARSTAPLNGESLVDLVARGGKDRPSVGGTHLYDASAWYRNGQWKLIVERAGAARTSLFDLSKDPGERKDLATTDPKALARVRAEMDRFLAQTTLGAGTTASP